MIDPEKRTASAEPGVAVEPGSKSKENERKKRSRVKQLLSDVKKQVEFWFGDVNLHKDRFLKQLIDESRDGYVDLSVLTSFNRMKKLTTDVKLIARALKNSSVVEVNLEGDKVRRQHPVGEIPVNVDSRTVYVELLPKDVTHSWIERVFSKCGNVVYVSLPRYKTSGDPKGFAFIEFETEEQARKAIETLNNPPEDAPRKPGIFPKTKNRKPIPSMPADTTTTGEEEEKKKRKKKKKKDISLAQISADVTKVEKMEEEPLEKKRKRSGAEGLEMETPSVPKIPAKQSDKKRRRSQTFEGSEIEVQREMPSKVRRTNAGDGSAAKKKVTPESDQKDPPVGNKGGTEGEEEGEEKGEDSLLKAKRKRKKKHKEKLRIGEEVVPLRVIPKKEWLTLKEEYLTLQKQSMASLKRSMKKMDHTDRKTQMETDNDILHENSPKKSKNRNEKESSQGPQFTSGVIIKITHSKPLPGRKFIKDILSKVSPVVYVDILEGDAEGHVRFKTPEDAKAVIDRSTELQKEQSWKLEILSEDHEQRYWQKILVDRQVKLNRPREKKRGTEKLISKAEKIIMARAKEAHKHIRFQED